MTLILIITLGLALSGCANSPAQREHVIRSLENMKPVAPKLGPKMTCRARGDGVHMDCD